MTYPTVFDLIRRYTNWLHTQWPAGHVEKLPVTNPDGSTNVPGLYIVGDLKGVPLLKFSSDTGARAVQTILADPAFQRRDRQDQLLDLVIIGSGVSGLAAAIEARKHDLRYEILEASEPLSTVVNFPKRKPIYLYPTDMTPAGDLQLTEKSDVKEGLVEELNDLMARHDVRPRNARVERVSRRSGQLECTLADGPSLRARRVIVAIGRSGNFRKLGVPGEQLDKVYNRLHDPVDFCDQDVLIVGGGDSALETAIAIATCGGRVTLSYRKAQFSRPKPDNLEKIDALLENSAAEVAVEEPSSERVTTAAGKFTRGPDHRPGSLRLLMSSRLKRIEDEQVELTGSDGRDETIANDAVFVMIGREAPLELFRRSAVHISGEWRPRAWISFVLFLLFCAWLYHWKSKLLGPTGLDPERLWNWITQESQTLSAWASEPTHFLYTLKISASARSFYYSLAYCLCVLIFGIRRIRRRKTPYVTVQTVTLTVIQWVPLFLLPELILPWLGCQGVFDDGFGRWLAGEFFPVADYDHGREYWRAYGLILAWPLFVYNFFTQQPLAGWLVVGCVQTFVIIPALIYYWGKGAYCGWICPCGALAETMGDTHRHKMPHGPLWNRLNMIGQVFLAAATLLMITRIGGWVWPGSWVEKTHYALLSGVPVLNYRWFVDLLFAGILGVGMYFHFSGRVWCRFACPLAALMHIYARFCRFRILADKKKCISCNVCTSVCHQGIDVMNFANKGLGMDDPQCVRCSACVQSCPTGVLSFGQVDRKTGRVIRVDRLGASPVQMAELTVDGKSVE